MAKHWTWDELAENLGTSRTTLHYLRVGRHEPGGKLLRKLEATEQQAGVTPINSPEPSTSRALIDALHASLASAQVTVRPEDHDRGFLSVPLHYLRGAPPKGQPNEIKLSRPPSSKRAQLLADVLRSEDYQVILLTCMPKEHANEEFLNALTPFCITALTDAAMTLVFGSDWKSRIKGSRE